MANASKEKLSYEDFIATIGEETRDFVQELHDILSENGCKIEVKSAKSGYVVSYLQNKKTVLNYVFRKKGLLARIYANRVDQYAEIFKTFPEKLVKAIREAPLCKRLADPNSCNPKCSMGYDFMLGGERLQKCRYSAFQFLVCEENAPYLRAFLEKELEGRTPDVQN